MMMHVRALSTATPLRSSVTRVSSRPRRVAALNVFAAMPVTATRSARMPLQHALTARRAFSSKSSSSSSSTNPSFFKRAWLRYTVLLETHPRATKMVTGGAIAAVGDINCQVFLEPNEPFNVKRAVIFTFFNGVLISPILHVWYKFLSRTLPGTSSLSIAKRLALDQLVFAPSFLPIFFTALLTLEGNAEKVPEKLAEEWWPAVKANWVVWVPAQLINFRFVPGNFQVLFSNVIGLFWNSYMSFVSHTHAHAHAHTELEAAPLEVVDPGVPLVQTTIEPVPATATGPFLTPTAP